MRRDWDTWADCRFASSVRTKTFPLHEQCIDPTAPDSPDCSEMGFLQLLTHLRSNQLHKIKVRGRKLHFWLARELGKHVLKQEVQLQGGERGGEKEQVIADLQKQAIFQNAQNIPEPFYVCLEEAA